MKAILIDAKAKTVTEVDIKGDLQSLQDAVGGYIEAGLRFGGGDVLYVNEEGLINGTTDFFEYQGAHQPFAGNGIIVSQNSKGETRAAKLKADMVRTYVRF